MGRRKFMEWATAGLSAALTFAVSIPLVQYLLAAIRPPQKKWVKLLDDLKDLKPSIPLPVNYQVERQDGWVRTTEVRAAFVVLDAQGELIVFSNVCTHAGCSIDVEIAGGKREFVCPCHNGRFDLDGKRTGGPPITPLIRLAPEIKDGRLFIEVEA